jgi:Na+/phosphate symporter
MLVIGLDLIICIIGLLLYMTSSHPKWPEVGRMMFFCGLFAFLLGGDAVVKLLQHG